MARLGVGIRNIHPVKGAVDRSNGQEIVLGGSGLAVLGRAPLFGEVAFDERDAGSRVPLSPDLVISQRFERFWLFHPFVEAGTFRFAVLQGDDWIQPLSGAERLRMSGTTTLQAIVTNRWGVQLNNAGKLVNPLNVARLARVSKVTLSAPVPGAGPSSSLFALCRVDGPVTALSGAVATNYPTDVRVPVSPAGPAWQCTVEGSVAAPSGGLVRPFRYFVFDTTRNPVLELDLDAVLVPDSALMVLSQDLTLQMNLSCSFDYTEEPFN